MPTPKETQEDKIIPFLDSHVDVECTKCGTCVTFHLLDDFDAARQLAKTGWYATEKSLYCPTCQKKRLNIKKK